MSNDTNNDTRAGGGSRRRLLKTALLGGASVTAFKLAPESWNRPVVEAVSLPAHAQTSLTLPDESWASVAESIGPGPARDRGLGERLLNAILPEARAGLAPLPPDGCGVFGICIDTVDDNTIFVRIGFDGFQLDSGNANVSVRGGLFTFEKSFGSLSVNGALSADGQTWEGHVEGPCLFLERASHTDNPGGPMQRIRTALADSLVPSARAGSQQEDLVAPEINEPWEAQRNVRCGLSDEPPF